MPSGPDAMGNTWSWGTTKGPAGPNSPGKGFNAWGTPGINSANMATYNDKSKTPAVDFEISFTYDYLKKVGIDPTASTGQTSQWTLFYACDSAGNNCQEWLPSFPDIAPFHEVDFFAPTGDSLVNGDKFFVDVVFQTKKFGALVTPVPSFSASFSQSIPETSTWAMLGIGFAGIGLLGVTKRRKASRYAL